ncbi:hypothetical protein [Mucilaginibacter ginsenosidivorax]|uniref:Uncharacterized protein n=1 Tax=Mucilaginibacter ginsenosidivorax TaxID=862126 RepID=A0A5B8W535_9SPHI|nr:hypothetical protein [Mucilaginibacter ginsenosidivorax]QEC78761.1 hypothetical protein FSB76_23455 [Mucilaginibacter ginsenosidivorax]
MPSANIVDSTSAILQAYKLKVTEKLYGDAGIVDGSTLTSGLFYVFNGLIDKISFSQYDYKNFVVTATGSTTNFLTNKPQISNVYRTSTEYLYFLNDGIPGYLSYNFYGFNNSPIGSVSYSLSGHTTGATRVDISPNVIDTAYGLNLGGEFGDMFDTPFGSNYNISTSNYFTVGVTDLSGNTKSVLRTYILKDTGCKNVPVQIMFANQLGGYDSLMMFNPRETIDVTKTSLTKNPLTLNSGVYTDNFNNVFNDESEVINVQSVSTFKVISDALRDNEAIWLKELIKSPKVFIRLRNGMFYPITVTNLNYPVQQKRYSTSLIRLELTFTINDTGISF